MKCIVLIALLVVVVQAFCPSDQSTFECFETAPGVPICLSDRTWVCGNCGLKRAYCEAKAAGGRNPPIKTAEARCARTPKPQC